MMQRHLRIKATALALALALSGCGTLGTATALTAEDAIRLAKDAALAAARWACSHLPEEANDPESPDTSGGDSAAPERVRPMATPEAPEE